jgi:hypothetical protein
MFKIVDTFNGWEGTERYSTIEEANKALDKERKAFRSNPTFMNSIFCKDVVPSPMKWEWDYIANTFRWQ